MFLFFMTFHGKAQGPGSDSTRPDWVKMMENPNANFFKVISAYETYWRTHTKPLDEEAMMGEEEGEREENEIKRENEKKRLSTMNDQQRYWYETMKYQCKRYEDWKRESEPWVQPDGHILTLQERMEMNRKQLEESGQNGNKK